jgi:hypothetical protein
MMPARDDIGCACRADSCQPSAMGQFELPGLAECDPAALAQERPQSCRSSDLSL